MTDLHSVIIRSSLRKTVFHPPPFPVEGIYLEIGSAELWHQPGLVGLTITERSLNGEYLWEPEFNHAIIDRYCLNHLEVLSVPDPTTLTLVLLQVETVDLIRCPSLREIGELIPCGGDWYLTPLGQRKRDLPLLRVRLSSPGESLLTTQKRFLPQFDHSNMELVTEESDLEISLTELTRWWSGPSTWTRTALLAEPYPILFKNRVLSEFGFDLLPVCQTVWCHTQEESLQALLAWAYPLSFRPISPLLPRLSSWTEMAKTVVSLPLLRFLRHQLLTTFSLLSQIQRLILSHLDRFFPRVPISLRSATTYGGMIPLFEMGSQIENLPITRKIPSKKVYALCSETRPQGTYEIIHGSSFDLKEDLFRERGDAKALDDLTPHLTSDGEVWLTLFMGRDQVWWRSHRVYGPILLPRFLARWEVLEKEGVVGPNDPLFHKEGATKVFLRLRPRRDPVGRIRSIPPILHFVYLHGERGFELGHYLSVRASLHHLSPVKIYLHCDQLPTGEWWEKIKNRVIPVITTPPTILNGHPVHFKQHQADYIRLKALHQYGGIYLDLDIIPLKSFAPLMKTKGEIMMGFERSPIESHRSLCNAVIFATPRSRFIEEWLTYYEKRWGDPQLGEWMGHSTMVPYRLSRELPQLIETLPNYYFYPFLWDDYRYLEQSGVSYPDSYAVHLWETESRKHFLFPRFVGDLRRHSAFYREIEQYLSE